MQAYLGDWSLRGGNTYCKACFTVLYMLCSACCKKRRTKSACLYKDAHSELLKQASQHSGQASAARRLAERSPTLYLLALFPASLLGSLFGSLVSGLLGSSGNLCLLHLLQPASFVSSCLLSLCSSLLCLCCSLHGLGSFQQLEALCVPQCPCSGLSLHSACMLMRVHRHA